uniref:Uncharacterized protein n=1 Tax=Acrobeloides nanus TaxID=290746 RepID=A0A914DRQ2_9BILA
MTNSNENTIYSNQQYPQHIQGSQNFLGNGHRNQNGQSPQSASAHIDILVHHVRHQFENPQQQQADQQGYGGMRQPWPQQQTEYPPGNRALIQNEHPRPHAEQPPDYGSIFIQFTGANN